MKRVRVRLRIPLRSAAGLLALLVMAMPPPARADSDRPEYERTFQKTIAVKGGQRLEIEHSQGAVRVSGQNVSELKIAAKIRVSASDEAEGRKFGEAIEISVEESSGGVSVRTRYPEKNWTFTGRGHVSFSVDGAGGSGSGSNSQGGDPGMPHFAGGGVVTRPTIALIGEDGPEAVVPLV